MAEADETHYPVRIETLGVNRVVREAQILADLLAIIGREEIELFSQLYPA